MIRFILLSNGRTGSILLQQGIGEHPSIRAFGELFHNDEQERLRAFLELNEEFGSDRAESSYYIDGEDGAEYLREGVFHERPWKDILAVGYRMFYAHAREIPNSSTAWDYLIDNTSIHVIHLTRRNLVENWLSLKIAMITKEWTWSKMSNHKRTVLPPLKMNPEQCEIYCNQVMAHREWARKVFRNHPILELEYEKDLCGRFKDSVKDVYDFLGLSPGPTRQLLDKQAQLKPSEQLANYYEFKQYFAHTIYADFFE